MHARNDTIGYVAAAVLGALVAAGCSHDTHDTHKPGSGRENATTDTTDDSERTVAYWVAPMDPDYRRDQPGKSPMGMDLVPVYEDELATDVPIAGRATVELSPERQAIMGIKTVTARRRPVTRTVRTIGFVALNEERVHHVHSRVTGWLERVNVHARGERVRKGQELYRLYSPQLVSTQQELLAAVDAGHRETAAAARQRLIRWGVAKRDIAAIEAAGQAQQAIPFRSPANAYVHHHSALHGMFVSLERELYMLVELDPIWVQAQFYAEDLPHLRTGAPVTVTVPGQPSRKARIDKLYPTAAQPTRTIEARIVLDNPDLGLRPGMDVDVAYRAEFGPALQVPRQAVLRSGERDLVFVIESNAHFAPRAVTLGAEVDGGYIVTGGLAAGTEIVAGAPFLIDAESSLQAAMAKLGGDHQH